VKWACGLAFGFDAICICICMLHLSILWGCGHFLLLLLLLLFLDPGLGHFSHYYDNDADDDDDHDDDERMSFRLIPTYNASCWKTLLCVVCNASNDDDPTYCLYIPTGRKTSLWKLMVQVDASIDRLLHDSSSILRSA